VSRFHAFFSMDRKGTDGFRPVRLHELNAVGSKHGQAAPRSGKRPKYTVG